MKTKKEKTKSKLSKKSKQNNNILIIGQPCSGKTSLVYKIAEKMVDDGKTVIVMARVGNIINSPNFYFWDIGEKKPDDIVYLFEKYLNSNTEKVDAWLIDDLWTLDEDIIHLRHLNKIYASLYLLARKYNTSMYISAPLGSSLSCETSIIRRSVLFDSHIIDDIWATKLDETKQAGENVSVLFKCLK